VLDAEKLALEEAGHRVGRFTIDFVSLDDATSAAGKWDPGTTSSNARRAAHDTRTIAYLGELDSGATAVSLPILNQAGILQISPASTDVGLTRASAEPGTPDRYYPAGTRTFGRIVPADDVQATAQATLQKTQGCARTYLLTDEEVGSKGLAEQFAKAAEGRGLRIVADAGVDPNATNFRSLAGDIRASGADCMFFAGVTESKAVQLFTDVNAANPTMKLFGPDGVAEPAFARRLNQATQKMTFLTDPALDPTVYPPSAQQFFAAFKQRYGRQPAPYAIYGYEAMKVALLAIHGAGERGNERQAVIDAFFDVKDRDSVLGRYSIDENGDTTLSEYGADRVENGRLVFDDVIGPRPAS